ncbi:hypothetical protein FOZ61_001720 [Perkinsus olseni]|uniref:DNA polymerase n=1 Tax=Perkinsus olseni TaxID=32597 RepID=A0A7J6LVN5_PEROL|nr:hypothetical protein FOZ61_001720 [Perkinsus olseni]
MKRELEENLFLNGCQIYIVPLGSLSPTTWRSKILVKRAQEAGAEVCRHQLDSAICLACNSVSVMKLRSFLNGDPPASILKADWLCDCLDEQRKLPFDRYRIHLTDSERSSAQEAGDAPAVSPTAPREPPVPKEVPTATRDDGSQNSDEAGGPLDCNKRLSQIFGDLEANLRHNKGDSDEFRARSYRRAADKIDKLNYPLDSDAAVERFELQCGSGIGIKIKEKIREFVSTGTVKKAEVIGSAERAIGIRELTNVWGVGITTAEKWYAMGIRNVEALRHTENVELNHNQKIGLKYFEEFNSKIPRQEVDEISAVVLAGVDRATLAKYGGVDNFNVVVCGSYRRGKVMCGDVDFLITHKTKQLTYTENAAILSSIIASLSEGGVSESFPQAKLTDHLNQYHQHLRGSGITTPVFDDPYDNEMDDNLVPQAMDKMSSPTYFGVFQLSFKHIHRRIDIKVWSLQDYPYALVHFTGSGVFNRRMRYYAKTKLGLKVNDHGVFRSDGSCIPCKTEKDVFDCLHIKYIDPTLRESETALEILEQN